MIEEHLGMARSHVHKLVESGRLRGERSGRLLFVAIASLRLYHAQSPVLLAKIDRLEAAAKKLALTRVTEQASEKHKPAIEEASRVD